MRIQTHPAPRCLRLSSIALSLAFAALALMPRQSQAQSVYEPYTFTTLAGGGGFTSPDVPGSSVRFKFPGSVAVDPSGNLYVADTSNHAIRKVTPAGEITTLAGLPGTSGSENGGGARFFDPYKLTVDGEGNVYVAEDAHTIRKVTPEGVVTTIAGLAFNPGSADGIGNAARFNIPNGLALDGAGNLYLSEALNHTIRKLTPAGTDWVVTTIAGLAGSPGSANGTNRAARFDYPGGLTIDGVGNLYVADSGNNAIRKVAPVGTNWVVTTLAGRAGSFGNVDGTNSAARFHEPMGVAIDSAGTLYVGDTFNHTIRQVMPIGTNWVVTTLAGLTANPGSADGLGNAARFSFPYDVAMGSASDVYVADSYNDQIRKITPVGTNWIVTTVAGLGGNYGSTDGPGNVARFKGPAAVTVDSAGNTYVADQINQTIRKVTPTGEVTTLAGLAGHSGSDNGTNSATRLFVPSGVARDRTGNLYVADRFNGTIRKMTLVKTNWVVTTLAGLAGSLDSVDETGNAARFQGPVGVAVGNADNVYVADLDAHTIRRVTPTGIVTTLAGIPSIRDQFGNPIGGYVDGTWRTARFNRPGGVAVDTATNIYVADTGNHVIRRVTPDRVVTTIAGLVGVPRRTDGIGSGARFNFPSSIAVDSAGDLYVADTYNNSIRKLTASGTNWLVTTLGGMAGFYGTADGTGSTARFGNPSGVAVDSAGTLYVADFYFNTIRKGHPPSRILTAGFNERHFGFQLSGPPGQLFVLETSSDLVSWLTIWTNTFVNALDFIDAQSSAAPNRFYRAHVP